MSLDCCSRACCAGNGSLHFSLSAAQLFGPARPPPFGMQISASRGRPPVGVISPNYARGAALACGPFHPILCGELLWPVGLLRTMCLPCGIPFALISTAAPGEIACALQGAKEVMVGLEGNH